MATPNIQYPLVDNVWDEKIKVCCTKPNPENPPGVDCCFDSWTDELKCVNKKYKAADELAKQKTAEFTFVSERAAQFKKWYDELTKTGELGKAICDQLEILYEQVDKVSINTQYTVDAIKILFCMVRDYYLQLDILKQKYDDLLACIKCLNNPGLVPGEGLMKLIEDYGVKLVAAQALRDELLKMVMAALALAEKIDLNIGPDFGLLTVVNDWKNQLKCDVKCDDGSTGSEEAEKKTTQQGIVDNSGDCDPNDCELKPMLEFPICKNNGYIKRISDKYNADIDEVNTLQGDLLILNKDKESLLACKQSLESAIKEVDPKTRCK